MEGTVFLYDRGKTAIIYKEREYSYKEMIEGIKYYATLLQLETDDRVMVCLENRPESMMTLFSIWERKGISVNVDASSNVEQLTYFIQDAEPKYIYASDKNIENVTNAVEESGLASKIINVDEINIPEQFPVEEYSVKIEDGTRTAVMLYTSGTTGNPKGVMLSYENIMENIRGVKAVDLKTPLALIKAVHSKTKEVVAKDSSFKKILEECDDVKLPVSSWVGKVAHIFISLLLGLLFSIKIENKEKLAREGAAIYIANHQSFLDVLLMNKALSLKQIGELFYIATIIHFRGAFKQYLCNHGNVVLVDVNRNLRNTLKAAAKILKSDKKLMIFPEGARTRDGKLQEFKKTYAMLAKELNLPIIPMVVQGAFEAMPFGQKPKWGSKMRLKVLDPIFPTGKTVEEIIEESKRVIAEELKRMEEGQEK